MGPAGGVEAPCGPESGLRDRVHRALPNEASEEVPGHGTCGGAFTDLSFLLLSLPVACGPADRMHRACRVAVEVVTTMTSADVMWQDGSVECNIRSNDLFPVHHLDNNEFCPGDFVVDKRGSAGPRRPPSRGPGQGLGGRGRRPRAQGGDAPFEELLQGLGQPSLASASLARGHGSCALCPAM